MSLDHHKQLACKHVYIEQKVHSFLFHINTHVGLVLFHISQSKQEINHVLSAWTIARLDHILTLRHLKGEKQIVIMIGIIIAAIKLNW